VVLLYCLSRIEDIAEKDNMDIRNYIKTNLGNCGMEVGEFEKKFSSVFSKRRLLYVACGLFFVVGLLSVFVIDKFSEISISEEPFIQLSNVSVADTSAKKGFISIPSGVVKANPFLPYREGGASTLDVPRYSLVEPPEVVNENSDAARVMDTIVSGILYDKYSPSAILNIEGNDYLVKKGDVVNNYKVLNIMQDSVTVKLGANVYKAGIGEILTEGALNHNNVSNLSKKFGGER
jgi:hypothetical protein